LKYAAISFHESSRSFPGSLGCTCGRGLLVLMEDLAGAAKVATIVAYREGQSNRSLLRVLHGLADAGKRGRWPVARLCLLQAPGPDCKLAATRQNGFQGAL
jgi:hypothetical protein